jgi:hypothetical protein
LAGLALALGVGATLYHQRATRALADYQKRLVASGEHLTIEELTPPPLPAAQNGADIFFQAMRLINTPWGLLETNPPSGMTMVAPGKARIGSAQADVCSREATNTWEEACAAVDELSPPLDLLAELIKRPRVDFNLNYQLGFFMPLANNLAQSKRAAQRLYYATLCELHRGDAETATIRLRTLLALVQASTDDRLVISQMVRLALAAYGNAATWEFIQSSRVTDAQLTELQRDWSRLEFIRSTENALAMERAMGLRTVERMRNSSSEFRKGAGGYSWPGTSTGGAGSNWLNQVEQFSKDTWNNTRLKAKETVWDFSWSYTDQLRTLKGIQVLIETARLARTNGNFGAALTMQEQRLGALGIQPAVIKDSFGSLPADLDFRTLLSQGVLSLTKVLDKVMQIETARQLTITAIVLQRYKLRHGNYPPDLAALVPHFLPAIPRDPVNGEDLHYRPNADGRFLLYSVGEDCEDNGGDPKSANTNSTSLYWLRGRDWVWPQPATPQEIESFPRHRPQQP